MARAKIKKCVWCGEEFEIGEKEGARKYCSERCVLDIQNERMKYKHKYKTSKGFTIEYARKQYLKNGKPKRVSRDRSKGYEYNSYRISNAVKHQEKMRNLLKLGDQVTFRQVYRKRGRERTGKITEEYNHGYLVDVGNYNVFIDKASLINGDYRVMNKTSK